MSILNKNESKVRESMLNTLAVTEYLLAGGRVTVCPPKKVKVSRAVTGKEKIRMGYKAPINRPSLMYDNIVTK